MYELESLGWHSFQQLCLTITREMLGQTVQSFLDSNDGGRDGAFAGSWVRKSSEILSGQFVIQCKFTSRKGHNLILSDLSDEFEKTQRLVEQGRCDIYVLITNAGLSGTRVEEIENKYKECGVKQVLMYGSTWVCDQIRENKKLRMLVPRIYGLGDLSQILDDRAYSQAKALLDAMSDDLSKVVLTGSYNKAAEALEEHGFVLLIGEPAAGKTTIASMLAMSAIDQWQSSPLKLDDPTKVTEHWNPEEPSQLFWIDDAFGVTQYESHLVLGWNHALLQIKTMMKKGVKIVMTSRDYIYNQARKELKESAFPLFHESQVVIDVHDLTLEEKQQILYNHLKLGNQPNSFRTEIKPFLEDIAANDRFIPEIARRLSDTTFTKKLTMYKRSVLQFVEKQESFLNDLLAGLDNDCKAALALIYMRNDNVESPVTLEESEKQAIDRLGSTLAGCLAALDSLRGSLVQLTTTDGDNCWHFKHPTIGDAYASSLSKSPELLEIFVKGSSTEKLMMQVTCGDVGYKNAVVLGKVLFPLIIMRLSEDASTPKDRVGWLADWHAKNRTDNFLAHRCSKEFLELYLIEHPELLSNASNPGLFLYAAIELNIAIKLHSYGLFPEFNRLQLVKKVSDYAIEGEDLYALTNPDLMAVMTDNELSDLRFRIRSELIPRIDDVRDVWQDNLQDEGPDEQMQPFLDTLETIRKEFDDPVITALMDKQIDRVNEWIAEQEDESEPDSAARLTNSSSEPIKILSSRSIFDDIDD